MINEQGRAQIGKGWGDAQNPDCSGFTVAQLQSLNFAAMDLREFYASIVPTLPNIATIQAMRRLGSGIATTAAGGADDNADRSICHDDTCVARKLNLRR